MTYRERRLARAERLRGWSDKNAEKGSAQLQQSHAMMDAIPFGQPILVGHHSEHRDRNYRERAWTKLGTGVELQKKAERQADKADTIEGQAERAIYDDDPDAIERLQAKITALESQRESAKAYNKAHVTVDDVAPPYRNRWNGAPVAQIIGKRKGELQVRYQDNREEWVARSRCHPALGGYVSANLSGLIGKTRERLARLQNLAANDATRETWQAAGATIARCINRAYVEVAFPERPDDATLAAIRCAGFHFDRKRCCWTGRETSLPEVYRA